MFFVSVDTLAGTNELIPKLYLSTQYQQILTQLQLLLKPILFINLNSSWEMPFATAPPSQIKFESEQQKDLIPR